MKRGGEGVRFGVCGLEFRVEENRRMISVNAALQKVLGPGAMKALGLGFAFLEPQTTDRKPQTFIVFSVAYSVACFSGRGGLKVRPGWPEVQTWVARKPDRGGLASGTRRPGIRPQKRGKMELGNAQAAGIVDDRYWKARRNFRREALVSLILGQMLLVAHVLRERGRQCAVHVRMWHHRHGGGVQVPGDRHCLNGLWFLV